MAQDSMVAEYRGERLRREVADKRERLYRAQGKDCYLFGVSDDLVIDSTMRGTISRFAVRPTTLSTRPYHIYILLYSKPTVSVVCCYSLVSGSNSIGDDVRG